MRQLLERVAHKGTRVRVGDRQKRVLITGATDGIGVALARLYAREGATLTLIGRRPAAELDPTLPTLGGYCRADLAAPDAVKRIGGFLKREGRDRLDLAILNAGIGWVGPVEQHHPDLIRRLVTVNLAAPIALAQFLLPMLRGGQLALIGSVSGAMPCPSHAVYAATKAALDGLARSLRVELTNQVDVMIIHPGATRTGMHHKAGADLPVHRYPSANSVAKRIKHSIEDRNGRQVVGYRNAIMWSVGRRFANVIDPALRLASKATSKRAPLTLAVHDRYFVDNRPVAVVTGAANGIGLAVTRRLARRGYRVLAVDHDKRALASLMAERDRDLYRCIEADLADPTACETIVDEMRRWGPMSLLLHCAGTSSVGNFGEIDVDAHNRTVNVNLLAPMLVTVGALRHGLIRTGGVVVFVSSLSHFVSYPGASVYAASKDGLTSFARSLYVASASDGLYCLTVFPGPTRTDHARRFSPKGTPEERWMAPDRVAADILHAVGKRRRSVVPGVVNQAYAVLGRHLPGLTERVMRRQVFEPLVLESRVGE